MKTSPISKPFTLSRAAVAEQKFSTQLKEINDGVERADAIDDVVDAVATDAFPS